MKKGRNYWPAGIVLVLVLFMSYLIGFLAFSRMQRVDLVSKTYYEDELKYQQQIDRMRRTESAGMKPIIRYRKSAAEIVIEFPLKMAQAKSEGEIHFFRPSDSRLDFRVPLSPGDHGRQIIPTDTLKTGLWKLKLTWKAAGEEYYHEETLVLY